MKQIRTVKPFGIWNIWFNDLRLRNYIDIIVKNHHNNLEYNNNTKLLYNRIRNTEFEKLHKEHLV